MLRRLLLAVLALALADNVRAAVVYHDTTGASLSNFIPFGPDGTAGRPVPRDHLGNQVTLAGTERLLTDVQLFFGLNTNFGTNPNPSTDTYTVTLYKNDGPGGAPGTFIGSSSVSGTNAGAAVLPLTFPFSVVVPD